MSESPNRIWFAPDEGDIDKFGWAGVQSGKDRLYWETERAHHPDDSDVEYLRADLAVPKVKALKWDGLRAATPLAIYRIRPTKAGYELLMSEPTWTDGPIFTVVGGEWTFEAAKEAAQAYYETMIKEALE